MARSSSTTNTVGSGGGISCSPRGGQGDVEGRAARAVLRDPDAAPVGFDDRAADRKPEAQAVALGGEEGLEEPADDGLRNAGAGVAHDELHGAVVSRARLDG